MRRKRPPLPRAVNAPLLKVGQWKRGLRNPYPFIVIVEPQESGLPVRSAVNCAQMATIQQSGKASRFRVPRGATALQPIGRLRAAKMVEVEAALLFNLGIKI